MRRPTLTAALEIVRKRGTVLGLTRSVASGKRSSSTPRNAASSLGYGFLEEDREDPLPLVVIEVALEVPAVEAHLQCPGPRGDELLEGAAEVPPLDHEAELRVRPIHRVPEHHEELRLGKQRGDPFRACIAVQVLGRDLTDRRVPAGLVGRAPRIAFA